MGPIHGTGAGRRHRCPRARRPCGRRVPRAPSPADATTNAPELATPTSTGATGTPAPTPTGPTGDIVAIVTASGGGGLVMSVQTAELTALGEPTIGQRWLTFQLVLDYGGGEPNSVVFEAGDPGDAAVSIGDPPAFRLTGPACTAAVTCTADTRTIALTVPGPVALAFELTPLLGAADLLSGATFRTTLAPTFAFGHPGLDDVPISIELRIGRCWAATPRRRDTIGGCSGSTTLDA